MPADAQRVWTMPIAPPARARIVLASDPKAVRDALIRLFAMPPLRDLSPDGRGTAEIVLAEALNNVVEHAYAQFGGVIEVTLDYEHPNLSCEVVDSGLPMPGGRLPNGTPIPLDGQHDLPEGGFGWFLIRSLTRTMVYRHSGGRNTLAFRLEAE